ncbi:putative odorant receptor 71a isoform X1 [Nylanderia fulva]|uniref:putative odorant receptor 71a isoform X1 n=1 Tax=Nylanderia fulva TaxID=613905 RepID=UPI0010FB994A|nr:putative odorant receptor 71a isoform X1 [Nylanderia fulva]
MDAIEGNHPRKQTTTNNALIVRYRVYSRRVRMMLHLGGVLQDRTHSATQSYIVGFLVIFMCLPQCVFLFNFTRHHVGNLLLIVKCFGQICTFFAPVLMSACFLKKRKKLIELHETLKDLFERELAQDPEVALANLYAFDRPYWMGFCFTGLTILFYVCPSMISIIRQIVHQTEPRRYRLPFMAEFPWTVHVDGGFLFYLHYLYHLIVAWYIVITINSVDGLFGFYAFQISSVLNAMTVKLINWRSRETFSEMLVTCIRMHGQLLQCSNMLEDIWQLIIVRLLLVNSMLICALIFEASQFTDISSTEVFGFVFYISLKLLQTFMYALYGNFITSASEQFCEGIYFSEWPDSNLDRHVRANVIVTMMQKPITIRALKMTSVNVTMFSNVSI